MKDYDLNKIIKKFQIGAYASPYGEGHINDTFLLNLSPDKYILQRINHHVFKHPEQVMSNIALVTEHLKKIILQNGGNPDRETLSVVKTYDGENLCQDDEGNYYRMYLFIDHADTYQTVQKPEHFYSAAKAFGRFQKNLRGFDAEQLFETIEDFHNTKIRFERLRVAISENIAGRRDEVKAEIEFAMQREKEVAVIVDALQKGEIPMRVTHNDTKLNNVLFDSKTGEGVCVIDLDTVMPGSLLYDYGDALRFGTNPAPEDEKDLSKVYCDLSLFKQFTKGFLEELGDTITEKEVALLPFSAKLMTFECGIRFLTDYLSGDTYFKIHRPEQNLDRARTQFKLVLDMEEKMEQMKEIVQKAI